MATIKRFEDIDAWQLSRKLNQDIYPVLLSLADKKCYTLNRQMESSAGSIMDNIAEGFERDGRREFIQFLSVSKRSAGELRSQLYRALDRCLIKPEEFRLFYDNCELISNKLGKFINYLNSVDIKGKKFIVPEK